MHAPAQALKLIDTVTMRHSGLLQIVTPWLTTVSSMLGWDGLVYKLVDIHTGILL